MIEFRRLTQVSGFIAGNGFWTGLTTGEIYSGSLKGFCLPFLNCYACPSAIFSCPIGSIQHFVSTGNVPIFLLGMLGIIGLAIGRMGCGWLCPFGLIQDLMYKLPVKKITIPRHLSYLKYLVLIFLVVLIPYVTSVPWFSKLCPYGTLTAGIPWLIINPTNAASGRPVISSDDIDAMFALKLVLLSDFLILFTIVKRPFCRVVCPLGALFSLFNRVSLVQLEVANGCRDCGHCRTLCPMDLKVSDAPNSAECIRCFSCTQCRFVTAKVGLSGLALQTREHRSEGDYV